jgi:hypothetical protein
MTHDDLERRLRAWYEAEIGNREAAPLTLYASLAKVADDAPAPARRFTARRYFLLLAAATLILSLLVGGTIAIGSGLLRLPWAVDEVPAPVQALRWTPASLDEDWPVAIRIEPSGAAVIVPLVGADPGQYTDPVGDIGRAARPWLDIEEIRLSGPTPSPTRHGTIWSVGVDLAANLPSPVADPRERWIAYGLVLDTNGDGVPDVRVGMDNMPASLEEGHRAWRTELDTGRTMSATGAPYGLVGDRYVDTYFPGESPSFARGSTGNVAEFNVGLRAQEPTFRFYAWASLIEDGRVVATDYAPDVGWLEPAPDEDR